ncbi:MAG: FAD:protein FMN transferase [Paracoccus sp. (in: a-proteobacteria)]|uniref:FAD:protein FMN transferase n=1 Tax=Paracoccus sp. TaxID=267 RepID=UPI0026DEA1F8|nr:FAD:protein FMN transferase [Paracoccus sp. (in: a-proteobacteria)]MDO5614421.1 FAD:protein FMN transferase [Paracoccus sp. (in: a-proteobacteria)]
MTPIRRRRFIGMTAAAALLGAGRAGAAAAPQEWRGQALGAQVVLRTRDATPTQARSFFRAAEQALRLIERQFSLHRRSELTRLNETGLLANPSPGFVALMRLAGDLHRATGGAFDPTIQPQWLARATGRPAPQAGPGWQGVQISDHQITLHPGMALTLNGIAQGHAADMLAAAARRHDLGQVLIDAGEIAAMGGWTAAIADNSGTPVRRLRLTDRALATSSGQGTLIGPRGDLPHILDPHGRLTPRALVSVSAPGAALADGLSTALCVMPDSAIGHALRAFPGSRIERITA